MMHFDSKTVGAFVVIFDQGDEIESARMPQVPRYTPDELRYIGELGMGNPEMKGPLQGIGRVKRVFPRAVIRGSETDEGRARRFLPFRGPIMTNEQYDEAVAAHMARLSPAKVRKAS